MKTFTVLFVMVLLSSIAFSSAKIIGLVTDEEGNPLAGANVIIENTFYGITCDYEGKFVFDNLNEGHLVIKASFIGYKPGVKELELNGDISLKIVLERNEIMSDEVIVTSTRVSNKIPVACSLIEKEDLKRQNLAQDVPYLLAMIPSLVETSEAGTGVGYTSLRIRGTDATRINVTINGIPYNDSESQGVFWVDIPDIASSVNNIQVQRGVGTSTNGAGVFGATINFQTTSLNKSPYAEMTSLGGSFNTYKNSISVGSGLINNKFTFDLRYSKIKSDGYIQHSGSDHESFYLSGSYYAKKTLVKLNVFHGKEITDISWWGVPDYMIDSIRNYNPAGIYTDLKGKEKYYNNQTDNYWQTNCQMLFSKEISTKLTMNAALHYTHGYGYYEEYKDDGKFPEYGLNPIKLSSPMVLIDNQEFTFQDSLIHLSDLVQRKLMDNDFYGLTYSLNYTGTKLNASFGGSWNEYDGHHFGRVIWSQFGATPMDYEWYKNKGIKKDFNVFGKLSYDINSKLIVFSDLQYRTIDYSMKGPDDDLKILDQHQSYIFINPKAGLFYNINNKNNAYFSFGIANREPARADFIAATGDNTATPKPEKLYDYELGYNFKSLNFGFNINLYYMNYDNQLVLTGEKSNVGYDIMTNVKSSYRAGIETTLGIRFLDNIRWDITTTISKNKIKDFVEHASYSGTDPQTQEWIDYGNLPKDLGETDISYSPGIIGSSKISYSPVKNLNFYIISKYVGKQYFDNTSDENRKINPYFVNNLHADFTLETKFFKEITFNLLINNILNNKYLSNAYGGNWYENANMDNNKSVITADEKTWAYYFPQAGINILGGITLRF